MTKQKKNDNGQIAYLICDMIPWQLALEIILQMSFQFVPHRNNPISHHLYFAQPLLFQRRSVEHLAHDTSARKRWVGIERANKDLDLRLDSSLFLGVVGDDRKGTNALTIQA